MVEKQASFAGWRTTTRLADSWARVWQPLGGRRSWFCLKSPGRNRRISSLFTISRNSDGSGYRYLRRDRQIEGKGGRDPMMSSGSKIKHNPKPRRIGSLSCPGMSYPGMLVVVLVLVALSPAVAGGRRRAQRSTGDRPRGRLSPQDPESTWWLDGVQRSIVRTLRALLARPAQRRRRQGRSRHGSRDALPARIRTE